MQSLLFIEAVVFEFVLFVLEHEAKKILYSFLTLAMTVIVTF